MLTEKQLNSRSSVLPIEDIYTDADVNPFTDYDMQRGYKFDYPARWMNDPSEYKRIGIRRLEVTPTSHTFAMGIRIWKTFAHKIPCITDELTDLSKWQPSSYSRGVFSTDDWEKARPYWSKYGIPQDTQGTFVLVKPTEFKYGEPIKEVYYDINGNLNIALVKHNVNTVATVWAFEYNSRANVYLISETEYTSVETTSEQYYETALINDFSFTSENGIEEIFKLICQSFNENIFSVQMYADEEAAVGYAFTRYSMTYDYDYKTGSAKLKLYHIDTDGTRAFDSFSFYGSNENDVNDITELFNQRKPDDETSNRMLFVRDEEYHPDIMELDNVWDRRRIFVHASFSETRRNIIGIGGDWYDAPSKFFHAPTNTSEFNIWFTTDGKHVILPLYCPFVVELCFLMNYKTAKLT